MNTHIIDSVVFLFVNSDKMSKLWGLKFGVNSNMNNNIIWFHPVCLMLGPACIKINSLKWEVVVRFVDINLVTCLKISFHKKTFMKSYSTSQK